ncbi:heavy metal translocating P-type ATPase [Patescibacteria group bacterium]|nr:heavy metal translocating P-type ATPase [Patescibacteria group bacterium]
MTKIVLKVKGMHCASCAVLIDKLVGKQDGVFSVNTNYGSSKVAIEFDESKISLEQIDGFVNKLGYDVIRPDEETGSAEEEEKADERIIKQARKRVIASFAIAAPIISYYMLIHMFNLPHVHELFAFLTLIGINIETAIQIDLNYIYWILSTPIQFIIGKQFYRNAWAAVRVGSANMDVLVVLGTSAAYFYSMIGFLWFQIDHPFWESSAALISFILLGRYVEALAKGRASNAVKELLKLEAKEATVERDGQEVVIPLEELSEGDIIIVKPGEKIPVDGVIVDGETHIDEKVVTGESFPVKRKVGSEVIGATVNQEGRIKFKATKVGKDTLLNQIIVMVEEAQARRAPVQDLVDKISEYFVPAVVILSFITFAGWVFIGGLPFRTGLLRMIAVLVISCPCAMGLATPTALVIGIGRAAKFGIILKGGEALEKAYKVTTIVFDKTGTLTIGKPVVTDFVMIRDDMDEKEAILLASGAETGSEHPLARAIIEKGKETGEVPKVEKFDAVQGMGLRAIVEGKTIDIGNPAYMNKLGQDVSEFQSKVDKLQKEAKTTVFLLIDGKPTAIIAMADKLKPYAKEAIAELKKMGKEIIMITGDNLKTGEAIGREVGIDRVLAEVLPQDKAENVKRLQAENKVVAMVGDGINDSPALAQSDLGIAIGSGTDVAIETGDVVLVKDDLRDVVTAIQLSGKTIKKVWQNLFWAFFYNVVAIPIAGGWHLLFTQAAVGIAAPWVVAIQAKFGGVGQVFFNLSQATLRPEIAGFAMALSSVSVVLNSLLLKRYVPPIEKKIAKEESKSTPTPPAEGMSKIPKVPKVATA